MFEVVDHPALADGLLTIVPSLEVVGLVGRSDFDRMFSFLCTLMRNDWDGMADGLDVRMMHDNETICDDGIVITDFSLSELLETFRRSAMRPVRIKPTHFELSSFRHAVSKPELAVTAKQSIALSLANNRFPDDLPALAVRIDLGTEPAWLRLTMLRDELVSLFGENFGWSTLGFRFRMDHERIYAAGKEQAALGMRLLGVDWDDFFGGFTAMSAYGLRSINWQTLVSDAALQRWTSGKIDGLPPSTLSRHGHHFWQTGEHPSIVDRNRAEPDQLIEYADLGRALERLCQHFDTEWMGEHVFERWSYRWNEVVR